MTSCHVPLSDTVLWIRHHASLPLFVLPFTQKILCPLLSVKMQISQDTAVSRIPASLQESPTLLTVPSIWEIRTHFLDSDNHYIQYAPLIFFWRLWKFEKKNTLFIPVIHTLLIPTGCLMNIHCSEYTAYELHEKNAMQTPCSWILVPPSPSLGWSS